MAANPSFLSEGNYVNITEQYKKECALILTQLQFLPESSSLYPSFTESSQSSQFKNGRLSCRKHNCSARSFSAVYGNLRHNRLCLPEYLPKRVFKYNFVCVCIRPLRRCLNAVSESLLSLSLSACTRASVCSAAAERRKRSTSNETRANDTFFYQLIRESHA